MTSQSQTTSAGDSQPWHQTLPNIQISSTNGANQFLTSHSLLKPCTFAPPSFLAVMDNLIRSPNILSSHLFRADIYYDSAKDASFAPEALADGHDDEVSSFVKHMRRDLRPRCIRIDGFGLRRLLVRRLVPRNPALDRDLVQTCCFFRADGSGCCGEVVSSTGSDTDVYEAQVGNRARREEKGKLQEQNLVVYLPHVETEEKMPWYHPKVRAMGFLHEWADRNGKVNSPNQYDTLSIHIIRFESIDSHCTLGPDIKLDTRLHRTLQNLLQTILRHGIGHVRGYQKRANHDRLIPQSSLQDTYTRLKQKYAKHILHEYWKECTDATKGVFEDLGIAAFLIELWREMYDLDGENGSGSSSGAEHMGKPRGNKPPFSGFVDVACGNGVLVYILISEGYSGHGFDARSRKTWNAFPAAVRENLHRQVLIPSVLATTDHASHHNDPVKAMPSIIGDEEGTGPTAGPTVPPVHNGRFPRDTFVISNHADELSAWTPLLTYLSECPFICIPCCSHDLTGARFRAAASIVAQEELALLSQGQTPCGASSTLLKNNNSDKEASTPDLTVKIMPDTLKRALSEIKTSKCERQDVDISEPQYTPSISPSTSTPGPDASKSTSKHPSAYAALTAYISHLARAVGYAPEKEELRIPSTRNMCIVGRHWSADTEPGLDQNGSVDGERWGRYEAADADCTGNETAAAAAATMEARERVVRDVVERETGQSVACVRELWCSRASKVSNPGNGMACSATSERVA